MKSKCWIKNYDNMKELVEVETKVDEMYKQRRLKKEGDAIKKLKTNPKYFYSYAKRFSKTRNQVGQLVNKDGAVIIESSEQAELFRNQNIFFNTDSAIETDEEHEEHSETKGNKSIQGE